MRLTDKNQLEGRYYAEKADKEDWGHKFFCDVKIGEALLAVFTFFLVIYTARLYWATTRLAEADRPHLYMSELSARGLNSQAGEDGKVAVCIEFKFSNYGRSPAFFRNVNLIHSTDELIAAPKYETKTSNRFIIAVNGWYGSTAPSEVRVDAKEISEIRDGKRKMYVYGRIEYGGVRTKPHVHRFAYRFIFDAAGDASTRFYPTGPDSYWENT